MVKGKDELVSALRAVLGDTPTDDGVALLEDVADSFSDMETKMKDAEVEAQAKYDTLEAEWKERYTKRFSEVKEPTDIDLKGGTEESEMRTFEDLFKTVE